MSIREGATVVIDVPYTPATGFNGSMPYQDYDLTALLIDAGTLIVHADQCVVSIGGFYLNGSHIVSPAGAYYDHGSMALVTEDGPVRDYLEIRYGEVGVKDCDRVPFHAWDGQGGIRIDNIRENSSVEVLNSLGQVVYKTAVSGTGTFVPMQRGIYVVRVNNSSAKVVVK